jgi:hypothetical protein
LDPEGGQIVSTALGLATSPDAEGEPPRSPAQRRADALVEVCRWFLDHQHQKPGGRHRPHLNVIINLKDLLAGKGGRAVDGTELGAAVTQALACDSVLHRVLMKGRSTILDYGTSTRTIPAPLWNALVIRDEHCRFPGCDRPHAWSDAHHVVHWARGGETKLSNLLLLCRRHHRSVHEPGGISLSMSSDGPVFRREDGSVLAGPVRPVSAVRDVTAVRTTPKAPALANRAPP